MLSKSFLKEINYKGFKWVGFWGKLHHFQSGNNRKGFKTISCKEKEVLNGTLRFMINKGLTRTTKV